MRYLPVFLLASILFFTTGEAAMAQAKLAVVGSSTSACTGPVDVNNCYIFRLRTYYNQQAPSDTTIDNGYAVGGYNCYRGMPTGYIPPYAGGGFQPDAGHNITAAIASHPNVILVNYPTNDYDVLPVDSILFCLRTIRNTANQAGIPCFITTTQPRTSGVFNTPPIKAKLAELKDSILLEFGYFAIDFWTLLINPADSSIRFDAGDGIHMNDIGHDSLFQRVLRKNVFLATLPATFLQFNTIYKNNSNVVTWSTAKETGVAYYEIQRSGDGINFSKIATVNAYNGSINNQYQFTDQQILTGRSYYKILIVDKDGKKHASPIMSVYINTGKLSIIKAFARSSSQLAIELQSNEPQLADLQVLNNMGMIVFKESRKILAGSTTLFLDTPLLSNGVYHIKLTTAKESAASSFIKN